MKILAILSGIAFVVAAALLAREMDKHDARKARDWAQGNDQ